MFLLFDNTVIRFDMDHNFLIQILESLHRRRVNMWLNMHITQCGLTQNNKILQDVDV